MGKKAEPSKFGKWAEEGELLGQLIDERYESRAEFARTMGVTPFKVSNWTRGITRLKGPERTKVARLLNVPENLLRNVAIPDVSLNQGTEKRPDKSLGKEIPAERVGVRHVPVYGSLAAGAMEYSYNDVVDYEELPEWGGNFKRWGKVVLGDSMLPEFEDGDIVIFEDRRHENGHAVHAFREGDDAFKIYRKTASEERLIPTNPECEDLPAKEYEVRGIAIIKVRYGPNRTYRQVTEYRGGYRFTRTEPSKKN